MNPQMPIAEIKSNVAGIIDKIDANRSGEIDFSEFVVASMNQASLLKINKIQKAFSMFDIDNDGFIERKELKAVMGGINLSDAEWDKLIKQYDTNGDGKVE
jgi:calcium-dependent protein kinase